MATVEEILMIKGPDVVVASSNCTVYEAVAMMAEANVGSVVVKDGDDVCGIFTERDLLKRVVAKKLDPDATPLADVMSSPVRHCNLSMDVDGVAKQFSDEHMRHLAVIEDGALIGLIGIRDVMAAQLRQRERQIDQMQKED